MLVDGTVLLSVVTVVMDPKGGGVKEKVGYRLGYLGLWEKGGHGGMGKLLYIGKLRALDNEVGMVVALAERWTGIPKADRGLYDDKLGTGNDEVTGRVSGGIGTPKHDEVNTELVPGTGSGGGGTPKDDEVSTALAPEGDSGGTDTR